MFKVRVWAHKRRWCRPSEIQGSDTSWPEREGSGRGSCHALPRWASFVIACVRAEISWGDSRAAGAAAMQCHVGLLRDCLRSRRDITWRFRGGRGSRHTSATRASFVIACVRAEISRGGSTVAAGAAGNAAENAYTAGRCNVWAARCNQGTDPPSVRGEHLVAFAVSFRDAADAQWVRRTRGLWEALGVWVPQGASGRLWQPGSLWEPLATSGSLCEPLGASGRLLWPPLVASASRGRRERQGVLGSLGGPRGPREAWGGLEASGSLWKARGPLEVWRASGRLGEPLRASDQTYQGDFAFFGFLHRIFTF